MAITKAAIGAPAEADQFYTPENDVIKTLEDGRVELVAAAGVPIPLAEATKRGLVKVAVKVTPTETKTEKPSETKE